MILTVFGFCLLILTIVGFGLKLEKVIDKRMVDLFMVPLVIFLFTSTICIFFGASEVYYEKGQKDALLGHTDYSIYYTKHYNSKKEVVKIDTILMQKVN